MIAYIAAITHLAAGDAAGYRTAQTRLIGQFAEAEDGDMLPTVVWGSVVGAAPASEAGRLASAADRLVRLHSTDPDITLTAGAAFYRAGRIDEAARLLDEDLVALVVEDKAKGYSFLCGRLFQAMTLHRLGWPAEARTRLETTAPELEAALTSEKLSWTSRLELRLFRAEAEATLALPPGDAPADQIAATAAWLRASNATSALRPLAAPQRGALLAQAVAAASEERWGDVVRVLDPIVDAEPDAQLEWFRWAISHAATGDRTAYRRACRRLRDRYGRMGHPAVAERTAKACLLLR